MCADKQIAAPLEYTATNWTLVLLLLPRFRSHIIGTFCLVVESPRWGLCVQNGCVKTRPLVCWSALFWTGKWELWRGAERSSDWQTHQKLLSTHPAGIDSAFSFMKSVGPLKVWGGLGAAVTTWQRCKVSAPSGGRTVPGCDAAGGETLRNAHT